MGCPHQENKERWFVPKRWATLIRKIRKSPPGPRRPSGGKLGPRNVFSTFSVRFQVPGRFPWFCPPAGIRTVHPPALHDTQLHLLMRILGVIPGILPAEFECTWVHEPHSIFNITIPYISHALADQGYGKLGLICLISDRH